MKTLILSSVLAVGLMFTGSAQADTVAYNSKTTQTVSLAPSSGGEFDGSHLNSKSGSGLIGLSRDTASRVDMTGSAVAYNTKTMTTEHPRRSLLTRKLRCSKVQLSKRLEVQLAALCRAHARQRVWHNRRVVLQLL